ncbi:phage holin family protein [Sphingomonas sp. MMS12-HWE2-04]|uniref:phage holin family protein n=1 Tax=Sphingomonas sp. MMS12-HWE2-04 TaxID=3234199 RepID=UPI00384F3815
MAEPETDASIGGLLTQLVEDGKGYAQAEIGYYRTLVRAKLREARASLWFGTAAISLALGASVALVVGLVLTLSPIVGPGFATLIVVIGIGALSGLMAWLAWQQVKRILGDKP